MPKRGLGDLYGVDEQRQEQIDEVRKQIDEVQKRMDILQRELSDVKYEETTADPGYQDYTNGRGPRPLTADGQQLQNDIDILRDTLIHYRKILDQLLPQAPENKKARVNDDDSLANVLDKDFRMYLGGRRTRRTRKTRRTRRRRCRRTRK